MFKKRTYKKIQEKKNYLLLEEDHLLDFINIIKKKYFYWIKS